MEPFFKDDLATIYHGDCREVMQTFPENSIDTILTDPPYGLKFMGKDWDHGVPGVPYWAEALRVAKPGAFLLAFGGTRTFHRLTCAVEDAGWEIRDCIMWLYGSGFPKSHDISKAIDKAAGAKREVIGIKWKNSTESERVAMEGRPHRGKVTFIKEQCEQTAPATATAQTWHGWGTALKPAWEPIIVAMKPLDTTFVNNALTWGVAGLNIDGCRIQGDANYQNGNYNYERKKIYGQVYGWKDSEKFVRCAPHNQGRWPANVILDEPAAEMLDEQSGILVSGERNGRNHINSMENSNSIGNGWQYTGGKCEGSSGGASRFFYTAKSDKNERGEDNNHPTVKPLDLMKYLCKLTATPSGGVILDPFMGSGTTLLAAREMGRKSIGIEIDRHSCQIARNRMKQGMLNFAG